MALRGHPPGPTGRSLSSATTRPQHAKTDHERHTGGGSVAARAENETFRWVWAHGARTHPCATHVTWQRGRQLARSISGRVLGPLRVGAARRRRRGRRVTPGGAERASRGHEDDVQSRARRQACRRRTHAHEECVRAAAVASWSSVDRLLLLLFLLLLLVHLPRVATSRGHAARVVTSRGHASRPRMRASMTAQWPSRRLLLGAPRRGAARVQGYVV